MPSRARQLLRDAEGLEKYARSLGEEIGGELRLVAGGFGFSLFDTPLAALGARERNGLEALQLADDAPPLTMGIACLRGLRLGPAAEAMHRLARDPEARGDVFARLDTGLAEAADL